MIFLCTALDRFFEQSTNGMRDQQTSCCLLKCGEMWNLFQFDRGDQVGGVGEGRRQFAVIQPQKLLEHQASKELRLRKFLWAAAMRVAGQTRLTNRKSDLQHGLRRFAGLAHT